MKRFLLTLLLSVLSVSVYATDILVEAESFADKGGWCLDQQFMGEMGSPYLLAHGMGKAVKDASTIVKVAKAGTYSVYVRTFNWTSPWSDKSGPGKFQLAVNGNTLETVLGDQGNAWYWQKAGEVILKKGNTTLALHDLTGFEGRCDAIFLTSEGSTPPESRTYKVSKKATYDLVVVGAGISGMCAAVAAARNGLKVALVNDRPILGGNNSSEIRVHLGGTVGLGPYPELGKMQREFGHTKFGNAQPAENYEDGKKDAFIADEKNITLLAPWHAVSVNKTGSKISDVVIRNIESSQEMELSAPIFADCTGDGTVGYLAGADYRMGREAASEYGESLAPEVADKTTMGASVQWYTKDTGEQTSFPEFDYGLNFTDASMQKVTMGEWTWETGMQHDMIKEFEYIRDYGLLVIYSNWSYLKSHGYFATRDLDWVAYVAGKRESRRLLGDYILKQDDIDKNIYHEDGTFATTWSIDLHFPDAQNSKFFPGEEFKSATVHNKIYPEAVPYRCLYSRNVDNLFMAGRNISVTHVALGTTRVMRTCGMAGEVVGMAAAICKQHSSLPRSVYTSYLPELQAMMREGAYKKDVPLNDQNFNIQSQLLQPKLSSYAKLEGDTLKIGNDLIERVFVWNGGNVKTVAIVNKTTGATSRDVKETPDLDIVKGKAIDGSFKEEVIPSTPVRQAYRKVTIEYTIEGLQVKRVYNIPEDAPAIQCETFLKGSLSGSLRGEGVNSADNKNIESTDDMAGKKAADGAILDNLNFAGKHWHVKTVEFKDVTDWNNDLVFENSYVSYRKNGLRGNLLFANNQDDNFGYFLLKEAPCSSVQLNYGGADFYAEYGHMQVAGIGLESSELKTDDWVKAYSVVLGVYNAKSKLNALQSLRSYQKTIRTHLATRDEMIMMNTWGDRSQDSKVNEQFCLAELEKAARLGITHFQIDDGWQSGKSPNSKVAKGSFKNIHDNPDYWTPDPQKYPHGLKPIVDKAHELGIEVGLWFNPSIQNDFADWSKDADVLIGLYRKYGIKVYKIDGLSIPSKTAEENLRKLFDTVLEATDDDVVFNLDATAGRRGGYHMFGEYGNIFLENRYTDWGNYYPYMTLRNLWKLSRYVPAERLQIEFLNNWRNPNKYPADDKFAPANYGFDYLFAITMAGQPLAWMEASNLPEEAYVISPLVKDYTAIMEDLHSGTILPIGDEPSGESWTGFQSVLSDKEGYLIVYREDNDAETGTLSTYLPEGSKVLFTKVLGKGETFSAITGANGALNVSLPSANSYALYKYSVLSQSAAGVKTEANDYKGSALLQNVYGRQSLSLNGSWNAIIDQYDKGLNKKLYLDRKAGKNSEFIEFSYDNGMTLQVPGDWNHQRPELDWYEGSIWYSRHFDYKKAEGRAILYFAGVSYRCEVFLNGTKVLEHEGSFTPFNADVTDLINEGDNFIAVKVNNTRTVDAIPAMSFDWWNYGGITRDVMIVSVPDNHIQDYFLRLKKGTKDTILVDVALSGAAEDITVEVPALGLKQVLSAGEDGKAHSEIKVKNLGLWSPGLPILYDINIYTASDSVSDRIGFRDISVDGTKILVNGEPIFMKSISFHEEIPWERRRAYSAEDAQKIIKEVLDLGCNMVRLAHYPQNENIVRLAEEKGLVVWEEIPVWQGIDFGNAETYSKAETYLREMISRDHNRCAIGFWSISNETRPAPERDIFLSRLLDYGRSLDSSRLFTSAFDVAYFVKSADEIQMNDEFAPKLDLIGINKYMGWYAQWPKEPKDIKWNVFTDMPLIMTEFGCEAKYGIFGHENEADSWSEDYMDKLYKDNFTMFDNIPNLAGVSPWVLFDFRSPYRQHPVKQSFYNRKGILSEFGERKKAWTTINQYYNQH